MCLAGWLGAQEKKITSEELLAKHLASIGTQQARAAAVSRLLRADAQVNFVRGGAGIVTGAGNILSEGKMLRIGMAFNAPNYSGEQLAFDGKNVGVGWLRPGERSPLSDMLYTQNYIIKEGLLGGTLSTAWSLLHLSERQARLDYRGLKRLEGKACHEVLYRPKKGGTFQILLYFDETDFRHVRTQYRMTRPALMGGRIGDTASTRDTIHLIIEDFDNFKAVDSLMLPHSYQLSYTVEGGSATTSTRWILKVTELAHNQKVDPRYFTIR